MKRLILLFILFSTYLIQCQEMKPKTIDVSNAALKIDSCEIEYQGKRLQMGESMENWVKVLGKSDREFLAYLEDNKGTFVWDNLGIAIDNFENGENEVAWLYIFFLNLDSPEGGQQMLTHARDFESGESIANRNMEGGKSLISEEQIKMFNKENEQKKKDYIYPLNVYQGVVNLHGYPVKAGMKVKEINSYRNDLDFSSEFRYIDQDYDGVNDTGNTTETFGGDYRAGGCECKDGRLQYYELTYTATGQLEYLKIGYESKNEYENRKLRED
jgi:hypothetical protein